MKLLLVKTCPLVGNLSALDHNNNGISDVWESRYPASAAEPSVEDDIEFLQGTNPRSLTDSDNNTLPIIAQNRFYRLTIPARRALQLSPTRSLTRSPTTPVTNGTFALGAPVPSESRFGIIANSSGNTHFDTLRLYKTSDPAVPI